MGASENVALIRMVVVLAVFVPVMLFGLYATDVKKHGGAMASSAPLSRPTRRRPDPLG